MLEPIPYFGPRFGFRGPKWQIFIFWARFFICWARAQNVLTLTTKQKLLDPILYFGPRFGFRGPKWQIFIFWARFFICWARAQNVLTLTTKQKLLDPILYFGPRFGFRGPKWQIFIFWAPKWPKFIFFVRIFICSECTHLNIPNNKCWNRFLILSPFRV